MKRKLKSNELIEEIKELMNGEVGDIVRERIAEFRKDRTEEELFNELCFCVLTANFSARGGIRIQEEIGDGFITLSEEELKRKLKELGHRYPNTRARYIVENRKIIGEIKEKLRELRGEGLREWFIKNVKGFGHKEASHFLRNVGHLDYAIIDFHVIDLLARYGIIRDKPKHIGRKKYLEIEGKLKEMADELNISLGELDLYLWYIETGVVLK